MPRSGPTPQRWGRGAGLPPELHQVNLNAAGVDIGAGSHYVAVPAGRDPEGGDVREFGSFTADLHAPLADWLTRCGIDTVAMESTGVYWIPLFELLNRMSTTLPCELLRPLPPHLTRLQPGNTFAP